MLCYLISMVHTVARWLCQIWGGGRRRISAHLFWRAERKKREKGRLARNVKSGINIWERFRIRGKLALIMMWAGKCAVAAGFKAYAKQSLEHLVFSISDDPANSWAAGTTLIFNARSHVWYTSNNILLRASTLKRKFVQKWRQFKGRLEFGGKQTYLEWEEEKYFGYLKLLLDG